MPIVRALTFFIPSEKEIMYDSLDKYYSISMEIVDNIGLRPWTVRYVFPPIYKSKISKSKIYRLIDKIYSLFTDEGRHLINAFPVSNIADDIGSLGELLSNYPKLYSTIYLNDWRKLTKLIDEIYMADLEPDAYTRISVSHYKMIETPYFPNTANLNYRFGFSIALRYIDLFEKYLNGSDDLLNYLNKLKSKISKYRDSFIGLDYSLSPWMDESVAGLIEKEYRVKIGMAGSYSSIYDVNMKIKELMKQDVIKPIGYNEVMLPVGEDNTLKMRVSEGILSLEVLIGLTAVCVVGLDMVAIEKNRDLITKVLIDIDSISWNIKKPMGTRIIPVNIGEDKIYISRFGEIPVIKYMKKI